MDDRIVVSSAELHEAAEKLRRLVEDIDGIFNEAKTEVNNTARNYQSNSGDNLRDRFLSLSQRFPDFCEAIRKYAKFLDATATSYEDAEQKITQSADEKLNDDYNG